MVSFIPENLRNVYIFRVTSSGCGNAYANDGEIY